MDEVHNFFFHPIISQAVNFAFQLFLCKGYSQISFIHEMSQNVPFHYFQTSKWNWFNAFLYNSFADFFQPFLSPLFWILVIYFFDCSEQFYTCLFFSLMNRTVFSDVQMVLFRNTDFGCVRVLNHTFFRLYEGVSYVLRYATLVHQSAKMRFVNTSSP